MKIAIKSQDNTSKGSIELPKQFNEEVRPDLIRRAYLTVLANTQQPYGAKEDAGMRASAKLSRRRRDYKGSYGYGISRVPRKVLSRRGTRFFWVGAVAPGMVSGRRAHPPKPEKVRDIKLNQKERRKAIRSALSASLNKELVKLSGHKVPEDYPFILEDSIENISKTSEIKKILTILGFKEELQRASKKTIRAGRGKLRGRKYKTRKGPLLVVSKPCKLLSAARNIPGVDVSVVTELNAKLLAPGSMPGRPALYSKNAIEVMKEKRLFV